ncbi:hypothetical protein [Jannaschia marina]|uniref:hypothetical protein n=1 Tax=Jannaschia marina TaxID=2741674 RepID=UPI0015CD500C|nr:hypothetical protein [Jannaschia marina]
MTPRRYTLAAAVAGALAVALFVLASTRGTSGPPEALDLRPGEFLSESLARSTYDAGDLRLRSDGPTQILLTPFETDRPRPPVIRLRSGDTAVTLPFVPARGDLYVAFGQVAELDLGFYNFDALDPDAGRDLSGEFDERIEGTAQVDIDAILTLFDSLRPFDWAGDQTIFCARERSVASRHARCLSQRVFDTPWPPQEEVRSALADYRARLDAAWATDDWAAIEAVDARLTLGQWTGPAGARISLSVAPRFDVTPAAADLPPSQRARGLAAQLGIDAYLADGPASRIGECFGRHASEGEILASVRAYTPAQARHVFGGLFAGLLDLDAPPEEPGTLRRALLELDPGRAASEARLEAACRRLPALEATMP